MNIFRRKKEKEDAPKVCGWLNMYGKFYTNREERDRSDREFLYNKKLHIITERFRKLIGGVGQFKRNVVHIEDLLSSPRISKELLEIYGEYLSLKQEYERENNRK